MVAVTLSKVNYEHVSNIEAFLALASVSTTVAFDVETDTTPDQNLKLMQFGLENGKQYLVAPKHILVLEPFLMQTTLIAHNAIFEIGVLAKYNIYPKNWIDTMLVENIILGGDPHREGASLAKTLKRYFGIEMDKTMQTAFGNNVLTKQHYEYAAGDVAYLHALVEAQKQAIGYNKKVVVLELSYLNVIAEMHLTGMRVDVVGWRKVIVKLEQQKQVAKLKLDTYAYNINWNSPAQKLKVLNYYDIPVTSTAKTVIAKYSEHALVKDLLHYAELSSQASKLGENFLHKVDKTGIIRTNYKQIIDTGRSSSRAVNLQNIPKSHRKYFSPSKKGNVFVSADYSQQELVILGFAAQESSWIEAAKKGLDLHSFCARALYPTFDDMTAEEQKAQRTKIKSINFSLAYGTGMHSLAESLGMSYTDTCKLEVKYYKAFPNIEVYLSRKSIEAKEYGATLTLAPFNRRRLLASESLGRMGRKGKNSPIQGSAADQVKLACNLLASRNLPMRFVHVIHDEILLECHPKYAQEIEYHLVECMELAGDTNTTPGIIHAESKITETWGAI